jgi:hypothetical protein
MRILYISIIHAENDKTIAWIRHGPNIVKCNLRIITIIRGVEANGVFWTCNYIRFCPPRPPPPKENSSRQYRLYGDGGDGLEGARVYAQLIHPRGKGCETILRISYLITATDENSLHISSRLLLLLLLLFLLLVLLVLLLRLIRRFPSSLIWFPAYNEPKLPLRSYPRVPIYTLVRRCYIMQ